MNDYKFLLTPYTGYVKSLCGLSSNDFNIHDASDSDLGQTDVHLLSSPHLNIASDPNELASKLKGLLMLMNGSLAVLLRFQNYDHYGFLSIDGSDGVPFLDIAHFKTLDVTQVNPFNPDDIKPLHPRANDFSRLINLASKHEELRIILGMCALGNDWVNLYRLWETVKEFTYERFQKNILILPDEKKSKAKYRRDDVICKAFKIDEKEMKLFTGTANSFELLGYMSRHGKKEPSKGIMTTQMTRAKAIEFVHAAVFQFCKLYYK